MGMEGTEVVGIKTPRGRRIDPEQAANGKSPHKTASNYFWNGS